MNQILWAFYNNVLELAMVTTFIAATVALVVMLISLMEGSTHQTESAARLKTYAMRLFKVTIVSAFVGSLPSTGSVAKVVTDLAVIEAVQSMDVPKVTEAAVCKLIGVCTSAK